MDTVVGFAENFSWSQDLPAKAAFYPIGGSITYLITVQALKRAFPNEVRSVTFEILHNALLVFLSFSMFLTTLYGANQRIQEEGLFDGLICAKRSPETLWDGTLGAVTYVFYLTKYLEYFDTFVLALRKKNIIVLHQWHHSCMTIVCWSWFAYPWLEGAWWCTLVNSLIHTFMYSFYLATTLKIRIPGKAILTALQIFQFITGLIYSGTFMYYKISGAGCSGNLYTAIASNLVNISFLTLFIKFFMDSYVKKDKKEEKKN